MAVGVGYPDNWRDYSSLTIGAGQTPMPTSRPREAAEYRQQLAKIGKPLDRGEWWMNAAAGQCGQPAGAERAQLPGRRSSSRLSTMRRPTRPINYGAIGAVIGHEVSHSFDNAGSAFDSTGPDAQLVDPGRPRQVQADGRRRWPTNMTPMSRFPGLHVKGNLTLGENIADVAGLAAAYDAYKASLGGKEAPVIDGFTGDQRFFIAYAQTWATKMRDAPLEARIATDGHAPGQYRALTVRNLDAWYTAFNVQPGDKLYLAPEKRVKIW